MIALVLALHLGSRDRSVRSCRQAQPRTAKSAIEIVVRRFGLPRQPPSSPYRRARFLAVSGQPIFVVLRVLYLKEMVDLTSIGPNPPICHISHSRTGTCPRNPGPEFSCLLPRDRSGSRRFETLSVCRPGPWSQWGRGCDCSGCMRRNPGSTVCPGHMFDGVMVQGTPISSSADAILCPFRASQVHSPIPACRPRARWWGMVYSRPVDRTHLGAGGAGDGAWGVLRRASNSNHSGVREIKTRDESPSAGHPGPSRPGRAHPAGHGARGVWRRLEFNDFESHGPPVSSGRCADGPKMRSPTIRTGSGSDQPSVQPPRLQFPQRAAECQSPPDQRLVRPRHEVRQQAWQRDDGDPGLRLGLASVTPAGCAGLRIKIENDGCFPGLNSAATARLIA